MSSSGIWICVVVTREILWRHRFDVELEFVSHDHAAGQMHFDGRKPRRETVKSHLPMNHFSRAGPIALAISLLFSTLPARADTTALAKDFSQPPAATKPRCYWYWFDDHVSKEGITRDLEAMREVGIGGAFIGIIGGAIGKRTGSEAHPAQRPLVGKSRARRARGHPARRGHRAFQLPRLEPDRRPVGEAKPIDALSGPGGNPP